jgi:hypothetical protein
MKIAYLILAHNTPNHLQRLINALNSDSSNFFIHIDKKSNLDEYSNIRGKNIYFIQERISVFWGDFSQVEAILILMQTAHSNPNNFQRFVLLSGSDYPIKSTSYIEHFFDRNRDNEFMNLVSMPSEKAGKPISRLTTYNPHFMQIKIPNIVKKIFMKLNVLLYSRDYKKHFQNLNPYAGSEWWALSREACQYILTFTKKETNIVNFFKNTICPDESFFHTILGNSDYKRNLIRNLTFTDWSAGGSSPENMTDKHFDLFKASHIVPKDAYGNGEILFARKFTDDSVELISKIEKEIR